MSKRAKQLVIQGKRAAAKRSPAKAPSIDINSSHTSDRSVSPTDNTTPRKNGQNKNAGGKAPSPIRPSGNTVNPKKRVNNVSTKAQAAPPPENALNGAQEPTPPAALPTLILDSGEQVQQWLVSMLQGEQEKDEGHKRKLFAQNNENKDKKAVSPTKKRRTTVAVGDVDPPIRINATEKQNSCQKSTAVTCEKDEQRSAGNPVVGNMPNVTGKPNISQKTTSVPTAVTNCERTKEPYKPVSRSLNFNSKSPADKQTTALNRNPIVRVSRKLISPAKNRKSNAKKGVSEGMGTDWRKLIFNPQTQKEDNVSIVMEYRDDDMRPPTFYLEEESNDGFEPLDLSSPGKRADSSSQQVFSPVREENGNFEDMQDCDSNVQGNMGPDGSNGAVQQVASSENNNETTPPARRRQMLPKESKRKRSSNPSKWQRNVASKAFNKGTEYTSTSGKLKEARVMKEPCSDKCNRCDRILLHTERETIFHKFWNFPNINRKRDFITRHIKVRKPDTVSTSPECTKSTSRRYFFVVDGKETFVCKTMFLNTLGVVDCWVETSLKKCRQGLGLSPDKRGHHHNRPQKARDDTVNSVKTHIQLFPRVPSHYTRERSKREYLETELKSVERMYRLYQEWAKEENIQKPASASLYRKIFNTEFNLGFFLPKKDQCETCNKWKNASGQEERREMVETYGTHIKNKSAVKKIKKADLETASASRCIACFDLQKVLICPKSETSIFFYKNKISLYNFTVFDTRLSEGFCYLWTETDGMKGSNEIGTNLWNFIKKKVNEGIQEFSFYSDGPTGQNKNRMIFSMYLIASAKFGINICHRFLEPGHTYTEADSMHARIESEAKMQDIFTPEEWINLIKNAKKSGKSYIVSSLKNEEILDLHYLVDRQNWNGKSKNKIYWSQVREVSVKSDSPNIVFYRYNFDDELSEVEVKMKVGDMPDMEQFQFPSAYSGRFPLPKNKADDIRTLLNKNAIPSKYHDVFEEYLNIQEDD